VTEADTHISAATGDADEYEKRIREKLFNSGILTNGEWVYLVGLFQTAREHEDCVSGPQAARLSSSEPAPELADRWPLGCHSPNSCSRNGRCMYVNCKHDGKDIGALASTFSRPKQK
jgi:hypothetical protein